MDKLRSRWATKIEIASRNNAYQQRILEQQPAPAPPTHFNRAGEHPPQAPLKSRQGRKERLPPEFTSLAANLWKRKRDPISRRVSSTDLQWIGEQLDSKKFTPVSNYLEATARKNLKARNSKNGNSSQRGAIRSWTDLVKQADKDDLQAMRKLMSRCASKHP